MKEKAEKKEHGKMSKEELFDLGMDIMSLCRRLNALLLVAAVQGERVIVDCEVGTIPGSGGKGPLPVQYVTLDGKR
jgi:hypothetical protein